MRSIGWNRAQHSCGIALLSYPAVDGKLDRVFSILDECAPVIVAFSGGVDSTLILKLALERLGHSNVLAVTGVSPSIPKSEQSEAEKVAKGLGANFLFLETKEMENENYRSNPVNRCFFCKEELFTGLNRLAKEKGFKMVIDGTNADDKHDWRPGMKAAKEQKIRSPLLEAGLSKTEIRELSRHYHLSTSEKPAMPCLSSRVPYGEPITIERLERIEKAEAALRGYGFSELRVRDHFPIARIEIPQNDFYRVIEEPLRTKIVEAIKKTGYRFVSLDLAGLKSGGFNL